MSAISVSTTGRPDIAPLKAAARCVCFERICDRGVSPVTRAQMSLPSRLRYVLKNSATSLRAWSVMLSKSLGKGGSRNLSDVVYFSPGFRVASAGLQMQG